MRELRALGGRPALPILRPSAKASTAISSRINKSFPTAVPLHQSLLPKLHEHSLMRHSYHPRLRLTPPFPQPINNLLLLGCHFDFCRRLTYDFTWLSRTRRVNSAGDDLCGWYSYSRALLQQSSRSRPSSSTLRIATNIQIV